MRVKDIVVLGFTLLVMAYVPLCREQQIAHKWNPSKVEEYIKTVSVVFVSVKDGVAEGAGVVISPDGTTLTVAHLFNHGQPDAVQMYATNGNVYDLDILAIDSRYDLALVRPKAASPTFKYAKIRKKQDVELNQDILIIGHPVYYYFDVEYGVVLDLIYYPWYRGQIMKISALVRPGNSGGPVFNIKGEVIGIVSGRMQNILTGEFRYGMAISPMQIKAFFDEIFPSAKYWPKQIKKYRLEDVQIQGE